MTLAVFFALGAKGFTRAATAWLAIASVAFYGYWNPAHVPLILASIGINYLVGEKIRETQSLSIHFDREYHLKVIEAIRSGSHRASQERLDTFAAFIKNR